MHPLFAFGLNCDPIFLCLPILIIGFIAIYAGYILGAVLVAAALLKRQRKFYLLYLVAGLGIIAWNFFGLSQRVSLAIEETSLKQADFKIYEPSFTFGRAVSEKRITSGSEDLPKYYLASFGELPHKIGLFQSGTDASIKLAEYNLDEIPGGRTVNCGPQVPGDQFRDDPRCTALGETSTGGTVFTDGIDPGTTYYYTIGGTRMSLWWVGDVPKQDIIKFFDSMRLRNSK